MDINICKLFRTWTKGHVRAIFGSGRTYSRGRKFAKEGYLTDIKIKLGDGDATISYLCWASQTKSKQHKVFLAVITSSAELLENRCGCTAGLGKCSNQGAMYHYLCAAGNAARYLDDVDDREDPPEEDNISCTSKPRTWGVPKRRVEPEHPVEDVKF